MRAVIPYFLYHCSLRVSAILDHFGYPPPHLDQWQQRIWYDLGLPRNCPTRCAPALHEAYLQWPVHRGPSHPHSFTSQLLCRPALAREGNSLRLLKVGAQPQAQLPLGLPHLQWLHLLKQETKKKHKITKCTVTSEPAREEEEVYLRVSRL